MLKNNKSLYGCNSELAVHAAWVIRNFVKFQLVIFLIQLEIITSFYFLYFRIFYPLFLVLSLFSCSIGKFHWYFLWFFIFLKSHFPPFFICLIVTLQILKPMIGKRYENDEIFNLHLHNLFLKFCKTLVLVSYFSQRLY